MVQKSECMGEAFMFLLDFLPNVFKQSINVVLDVC